MSVARAKAAYTGISHRAGDGERRSPVCVVTTGSRFACPSDWRFSR